MPITTTGKSFEPVWEPGSGADEGDAGRWRRGGKRRSGSDGDASARSPSAIETSKRRSACPGQSQDDVAPGFDGEEVPIEARGGRLRRE